MKTIVVDKFDDQAGEMLFESFDGPCNSNWGYGTRCGVPFVDFDETRMPTDKALAECRKAGLIVMDVKGAHPGYCCQRCGEAVGYFGRFMEWVFGTMHQCGPSQQEFF